MLSAVSEKVSVARNCRGDFTSLATSHYNRLPSGDLAYNVTFDRLYREPDQTDAQGEVTNRGEWKQSQSFGKDDLLLLAKLADLAHSDVYARLRDGEGF